MSGSAIEIMTGAPVPEGADAVVMVEHVVRGGDGVGLAEGRRVGSGENVVPRGSEARAGETVVAAGTVMERGGGCAGSGLRAGGAAVCLRGLRWRLWLRAMS